MKPCKFASLALILFTSISVPAQVSTGVQAFGSFGGGPFDTVNLGNLNVHFTIPILHRPGRGTPFNYDLSYDSLIWQPGTVNGTVQWAPAANWGWTAQSQAEVGWLAPKTTYTTQIVKCPGGFGTYQTYTTTYTYFDWLGKSHPFPGSTYDIVAGGGCGSGIQYGPTLTAQATDGSGYTLRAPANQNGVTITTRFGALVYTNVGSNGGAGTFQDANGNYISFNGNTRQFFDTLSSTAPVLTLAGSGTPSSPTTYTYAEPSGSNVSYTVNYTQYTVATNFGVSGIAEFGRTSVALVSNIQLPDLSEYQFTYEATPGSCTPLSGTYSANCVTGRIASVTLPTGGTITYGYTGGSNGILKRRQHRWIDTNAQSRRRMAILPFHRFRVSRARINLDHHGRGPKRQLFRQQFRGGRHD